jgi:hypothetical protein
LPQAIVTGAHATIRAAQDGAAAPPGPEAGVTVRTAPHDPAAVPREHETEAPVPDAAGYRAGGQPGTARDQSSGSAGQAPHGVGSDWRAPIPPSASEAGDRREGAPRQARRDLLERRAATDVARSQGSERPGPAAAPTSPAPRAAAAQGAARGTRREGDQRSAPATRVPPSKPAAYPKDAAAATQSPSAPGADPAGRPVAPTSRSLGHSYAGPERASASAAQQPDAPPARRLEVGSATLRVSGPEGGTTRVRVDVRGDSVRARIVPDSAPLAAKLTADIGDAHAALQGQGFTTAHVAVRTPPATPAGTAAPTQLPEAATVSSVGRSMDAPPNPRQSGRDASQQSARDPAHWQGPRSHQRSPRERER